MYHNENRYRKKIKDSLQVGAVVWGLFLIGKGVHYLWVTYLH